MSHDMPNPGGLFLIIYHPQKTFSSLPDHLGLYRTINPRIQIDLHFSSLTPHQSPYLSSIE